MPREPAQTFPSDANASNLRLSAPRPKRRACEGALFALWMDKAPGRALDLERKNVMHQREPLDLLVLACPSRCGQPRRCGSARSGRTDAFDGTARQ